MTLNPLNKKKARKPAQAVREQKVALMDSEELTALKEKLADADARFALDEAAAIREQIAALEASGGAQVEVPAVDTVSTIPDVTFVTGDDAEEE